MTLYDIKRMTVDDLDFAVKITQQEGWGYGKEDMHRILRWSPEGCFIVWMEGTRVGMATTLSYGTFGWVGNVVISKDLRCQGLGNSLMKHCIAHLMNKGAKGVRLFAYENTCAFYDRMGFRHDGLSKVYRRPAAKWGPVLAPEGYEVLPLKRENHMAAISLDSEAINGDRAYVLRTVWYENPILSYGLWEKERHKLRGLLVGKRVLGNIEVGPWVCDLPNCEAPMAMLDLLLSTTDTLTFMAVPDAQPKIVAALAERGFIAIDKVFAMHIGQPPPMKSDNLLAYGALEKG